MKLAKKKWQIATKRVMKEYGKWSWKNAPESLQTDI